jgi:hypothetical protein
MSERELAGRFLRFKPVRRTAAEEAAEARRSAKAGRAGRALERRWGRVGVARLVRER